MTAAEFTETNASGNDEIIRNTSAIARGRVLHTAARLLSRVVPNKTTTKLEFEYRYQRYVVEFGEADSNIVISTFSKSGTTWAQIIVYQLTTDGAMDFDHLFDISPWVWYAAMRQTQPMVTPAPRILKSHDDYRRFPLGVAGDSFLLSRSGVQHLVSGNHRRQTAHRFSGITVSITDQL